MLHRGMTSRHDFGDHWGSLPIISTTTAKIGDVIKFRYSHGRQPPSQTGTCSLLVEVPPHCPGTSSSEPLWYDDQLRTSIADVGRVDPQLLSPLPNNQKGSSAVVQQTGLWKSTEDFGLSAARVRIENRYVQQQQQQQQQQQNSIADSRTDDESNENGLQRLSTDDTAQRKLTVTRTKKDRLKDNQLVGSTAKCTERRKSRSRRPRARRGVAALGAGCLTSSSAVLVRSVDDPRVQDEEDCQTGNGNGVQEATVDCSNAHHPPPTTTVKSFDSSIIDVTGGDLTKSSPETVLYADPVIDSPISFQQRLAQMATLEAETRRTERQAALVSRAKRKQSTLANSKEC